MDDDNIKRLPTKFREPIKDDRFLQIASTKCFHGTYLIDEKLSLVECSKCHEKINPMTVLAELATKETMWHRNKEYAANASKRLEERMRCKCQHCGKMTRIRDNGGRDA